MPPSIYPANGFPTVLMSVCRRWRDIVLATPSLWSYFHANLDTFLDPDFDCLDGEPMPLVFHTYDASRFSAFQQRVERSQDVPLICFLNGNSHIADRYVNLLFQHAHRWKEIELTISWVASSLHSSASFTNQAALLLQKLILDYQHIIPPDSPIFSFFQAAPRLEDVTIESPQTTRREFPWSQLKHLSLRQDVLDAKQFEAFDLPRLLDVLRQCGRLTSLTIIYFSTRPSGAIYPTSAFDGHALTFLNLQHLSIQCSDSRITEILYTYLQPSNLRSLELIMSIFPQVIPFLSRLSSSLEDLKLGANIRLSRDAYFCMLRTLPNLFRLHIRWISNGLTARTMDPTYLDALALGFAADGTLVKGQNTKLKEIKITGLPYGVKDVHRDLGLIAHAEALARMVESRWNVAAPSVRRLEKLTLSKYFWEMMRLHAPDAFARLGRCVEEGLAVSVDG
ncbi:hypothetical protein EW146_g5072 [Bondarzewia mesenterica]|uniref:F-box domain-containing protein n=1 Tax=Bondarzewia mesenterica TaxID=1095465 RepID=A0A4S4LYB6_9AGAM|nr:hypothetical protein EW146_g5072 [Bondarzewia mesenterica]